MTLDKHMRESYVVYIYEHINELKPVFRQEILQNILCSVPENKIIEKTKGTEIKFMDINDELIKNIHTYIMNKLENNNLFI